MDRIDMERWRSDPSFVEHIHAAARRDGGTSRQNGRASLARDVRAAALEARDPTARPNRPQRVEMAAG